MDFKTHHIGHITTNLDKSKSMLLSLNYIQVGGVFFDKDRDTNFLLMKNDEILIELINPLSEKADSYALMKKYGSLSYHICYEVDDIKKCIQELTKEGYKLLINEKVAPLFSETEKQANVCFMYTPEGSIIELLSIN